MATEIDARGLSCPAPVLLTKKAIENNAPDVLTVIVDNEASRQNVIRFLESRQFKASAEQKGSEFHISATRGETSPMTEEKTPESHPSQKIMIMVSSNCIGHGDDELGSKLMLNFLKTLKEMGKELWLMAYVNNGVKLAVEGAETLPILQESEKSGVRILVCGTCLSHFNLLEKKRVGETTNMLDIVTAMQLADKVIQI
jgi:selenium metabolism protein YedF